MKAQDLYVKLTDPTGAKPPVVNYHRVWDADKFLASQRNIHEDRAEGSDKRLVSVASESEYKMFKQCKQA